MEGAQVGSVTHSFHFFDFCTWKVFNTIYPYLLQQEMEKVVMNEEDAL